MHDKEKHIKKVIFDARMVGGFLLHELPKAIDKNDLQAIIYQTQQIVNELKKLQ